MSAAPDSSLLPGLSGALLCGGRSRRMGLDKARLPWAGVPLLIHGLRRLSSLCDEVLLASGVPGRYADLLGEHPLGPACAGASPSFREVGDRLGAQGPEAADPEDTALGGPGPRDLPPGPLAGLEAALAAAQGEWVWITSCDLPLLTPELGRELRARARISAADAILCQVRSASGEAMVEPLCGLYRRELWQSARRAFEAGERRVLAMAQYPAPGLPLVQSREPGISLSEPLAERRPRLEFLELEGPRARQVFNLNTPEDWHALVGPEGAKELRA
jgi:molybdenum cofactor guanylyltransferase